jgi:hypothetical protein
MTKVARVGAGGDGNERPAIGWWRKIMAKLVFWCRVKPAPQGLAERLGGLWRPSEVLERDLARRRLRAKTLFEAQKVERPNRKAERRMRKTAKKLEKAAARMTRLAMKGRLPLEQVLPLAFPELEKWKRPCPAKTDGLVPFSHIEVPDSAVAELTDKIPELMEDPTLWNFRLDRLCQAVGGAALFLEQGGSEEDALTILNGNCGPIMAEALAFAKTLRLVTPNRRRRELARFVELVAHDGKWRDWEGSMTILSRKDLMELAGVARAGDDIA